MASQVAPRPEAVGPAPPAQRTSGSLATGRRPAPLTTDSESEEEDGDSSDGDESDSDVDAAERDDVVAPNSILAMRTKSYVAPSPSLQRQVAQAQAEAQAAAARLIEQRQRVRDQEEKTALGLATHAIVPVAAVIAAPDSSSVSSLESMQVWGRVVSVLSLSSEIGASDSSSDGALLATTAGRTVHVWATPSMRHLLQLNTRGHASVHTAPIRLVRFTPYDAGLAAATGCGFQLLTAGDDMKLALWNLQSGKAAKVLLGHRDLIFDAAFAPAPSELLFTASADGHVLAWDWKHTGTLLGSYARETSGIRSLALLPAFHKLVVACHDGSVAIWDAQRRARVGAIPPDAQWATQFRKHGPTNGGWIDGQRFHTGLLNATRLSPCGQLLATASADATVKLWSVLSLRRDGASLAAARSGQRAKRSHLVSLQPDADRYSLEALDGEEAPLDLGYHGTLLHTLRHEGSATHALFTPDSAFLVTAASDQTVRVWLVETGALVYQINVPAGVKELSFAHAPESFEPPPTTGGSKHFYIGRLHVAVASRVLVMDLAVLESVIKSPNAPAPSAANAVPSDGSLDSWPPKPTTASAASKAARRRARSRARAAARAAHGPPPTSSSTQAFVSSDALLSQFFPGAAQLLRQELSSSTALPPLTAACLNFAPSFLHQLLSGPSGRGVDRGSLIDNMRYFGLTPTFLLRIVAATLHFKPEQVLQGFARPRPACHPLFKLAFAGVPVEPAMLDMGFLPCRVHGAAGGPVSAAAATADTGQVYATPVESHAAPDGSNVFGRDQSAQAFQFIAGAGSALMDPNSGDSGFFFAPTEERPAATTNAMSREPPSLVHWEPATQLNLLAHLASNSWPVAPVHAEAALASATRFPLFNVPTANYVDEVDKLEARRRGGQLNDPYGGAVVARTEARLAHEAALASANESIRHAQPPPGAVYKGYTFSRPEGALPHSVVDAMAQGVPAITLAQPPPTQAPASVPALFASFVSGQVVPNGERADNGPGGSFSARVKSLSEARRQADRNVIGLATDRALTRSVAIPLRRSVGLKASTAAMSAEESEAALTSLAGPAFGRRTFRKPTRDESKAHVLAKVSEFTTASSEGTGRPRAPVSLHQLLETFSASDIERKTRLGLERLVNSKAMLPPEQRKQALIGQKKRESIDAASGADLAHEAKQLSMEAQARTSAAALALKDREFRAEIRHTLLHQTNSLAALDTELGMSSGLEGPVRDPTTFKETQLVSPFGGRGSSGLTLTPHAGAHALVGSGLSQTWHGAAHRPRAQGGVQGASHEFTLRSQTSVQPAPSFLSPLHQFSTMPRPQRTFSKTAATKSAAAAASSAAQVDLFPGGLSAQSSPALGPSSPSAAPAAVETQLQRAYAPSTGQWHKWQNKFSIDVPGLDVLFEGGGASPGLVPLSPAAPASTRFTPAFGPMEGPATEPSSVDLAATPTSASAASKLLAKHGRRAAAASAGVAGSMTAPAPTRRRGPASRGKDQSSSLNGAPPSPPAPPTPTAVRLESTGSLVLTRAFMLRPPAHSSAAENQLDLGLDQLPDARALNPAVRVELDAKPQAVHSQAHTTIALPTEA